MGTIRTGDFLVEIGKKGKFQSRNQKTKVFRKRANAVKFARKELKKGNAVAIDSVSKYGQRPLAILGETKNKYNYNRNFSTIPSLKVKKKRKIIKRRKK